MKKITLLFITMLSISITAKAQNFVWAKSFGNSYNSENANAVATDVSGNVITVGTFSGTVDFDPGVTVANLIATGTTEDIYISKLSSTGAYVWAKKIGNANSEKVNDVSIDALGNIYITGSYQGTVDIDPAATIVNLISTSGSRDAFIAKYTSAGALVWGKSLGGAFADEGSEIDIDASNSLYVAGTFSGTADFDPSATTKTVTIFGGSNDVFIGKYDNLGNMLWATSIGGNGYENATGIKYNSVNGFLYLTGTYSGANTDLSPNFAGYTYTCSGGTDIFVTRLNASNGDGSLITGVISSSGFEVTDDLEIDGNGEILISGSFGSAVDFDVTTGGTSTAGPTGFNDGFIVKYNPFFSFIFQKQITHPTNSGYTSIKSIKVDGLNNIYIGGSFIDETDFNPGVAVSSYSTSDLYDPDCFVSKYNSAGNFIWAKKWGTLDLANFAEEVTSIALDNAGNVYSCGTFGGSVSTFCDFDPSVGTYNVTHNGDVDAFVHKLSCTLPSTATATSNLTSKCIGSATSSTFAVSSALEAGVTYSWSTIGGSGILFSPTTGTLTTMSFTANATFSIVLNTTNACGTTTNIVQTFSALPLPNVTASASPTAVCTGSLLTLNGSGATTYTWSNSVTNGVAFTHSGTNIYTVTGTDGNGCQKTNTITITALANPTVAITGKNLICLNKPNTLTASGASTYTWLPSSTVSASIIAQPTLNTTYTVNATASNGCNGSSTFAVNLVMPVTPDICEVSADSLSQYNYVMWDKTLYTNADSFIVYREVSSSPSTYKRIGAQHYSVYSRFKDTARSIGPANGNPNVTSYRYKLQLRDTCGNYSALSLYHNTMYFVSAGGGAYTWNPYSIESTPNPVTTFDLFRDNLNTNVWVYVASCAGSQYSINDPAYSTYSNTATWRIDANGFNCNPTHKLSPTQQINKAKSNVKNNLNAPPTSTLTTGMEYITTINQSVITPNPAISELTVSFNQEINGNLMVTDVLGKVVVTKEIVNSNKLIISVAELNTGIYFLTIQQGNIKAVKKFVKE